MKKYMVILSRTGSLLVMANSESEAMDIANHQFSDTINWHDDWDATNVESDESYDDDEYVTKNYEQL